MYGAVRLVHADHFVAYHYRSRKAKRYEVGVLELFDGSEADIAAPFSALTAPSPVVLRQAFIFPYPAAQLAVSRTAQGITDRTLLFVTEDGESAAPRAPAAAPC